MARSADKGAFETKRDKEAGVVINKWDFVIYKLLSNSIFLETDRATELWLGDVTTRTAEQLKIEGSVGGFAWSPDGQTLAFLVITDISKATR